MKYGDTPQGKSAVDALLGAVQDAAAVTALLAAQPISNWAWTDPSELRANAYNPNHVAPPELALLKLSILTNGWTQPIVALPNGEIVDGFHRWTLGLHDPDIRALTGGLVPVCRLAVNLEDQVMATVRHNRARGLHAVLPMADLVAVLARQGVKPADMAAGMGMELEEVDRLLERGDMRRNGAGQDWSRGWVPDAPDE